MKAKYVALIATALVGWWLFLWWFAWPSVESSINAKTPSQANTTGPAGALSEPTKALPGASLPVKTEPSKSLQATITRGPLAAGALVQPKSVTADGTRTNLEFEVLVALDTPVRLDLLDGTTQTLTATLKPDGQSIDLSWTYSYVSPSGQVIDRPGGGAGWSFNGSPGESSSTIGSGRGNLITKAYVTVKLKP